MLEPSYNISKSIVENLSLTWRICYDAINDIPDEHWRTGENEYLIPARLLLHIIETLDQYSTIPPNKFTHGYRFNINWQRAPDNQLPSKTQLDSYLTEVKVKTESWIKGMTDEDFHSPETLFPWTGSTILGRILYSLEHCRQHLGELNAELRRREIPRIKWTVVDNQ